MPNALQPPLSLTGTPPAAPQPHPQHTRYPHSCLSTWHPGELFEQLWRTSHNIKLIILKLPFLHFLFKSSHPVGGLELMTRRASVACSSDRASQLPPKSIILKCINQWYLVPPQCYATVTSVWFKNVFITPNGKPIYTGIF